MSTPPGSDEGRSSARAWIWFNVVTASSAMFIQQILVGDWSSLRGFVQILLILGCTGVMAYGFALLPIKWLDRRAARRRHLALPREERSERLPAATTPNTNMALPAGLIVPDE